MALQGFSSAPSAGSGDLALGGQPTLFLLLRELQRACRAGRLTVILPKGPTGFSLDKRGCVCDFDGDLASRLAAEELLDPVTAATVSRFPGAMTQGHALVAGGVPGLTPPPLSLLRPILRGLLVERLVEVSALPDVRYFFDPNERALSVREVRMPFLDYGREWLHGAVSDVRLNELDGHFSGRKDEFPVASAEAHWQPLMLPLERQEERLVKDVLPKGRSLRDLLTFSPLSRTATYRLFLELEALEMLTFHPEPPEFAVTHDAEELLNRRLAHAKASQFGALGVHLTSHPNEYDAALHRAERRYGSNSKLARNSPKSAQLCRQVLSLAQAARVFLRDRRNRVQHRDEVHSQTQLTGFAQLLIGKSQLHFFRGEERLAKELLEVARELDPQARV